MYYGVLGVDNLVIGRYAEEVAGNKAFYLINNKTPRWFDVVPAGTDVSYFVGVFYERLENYGIRGQEVEEFLGGLGFGEVVAVEVAEFEGVFLQETGIGHAYIIGRDARGVGGDKYVWDYAAASVDGSSRGKGVEHLRGVAVDAVGGEAFAVVVAVDEVHCVFVVFSPGECFLDATARGGVVALDREADQG